MSRKSERVGRRGGTLFVAAFVIGWTAWVSLAPAGAQADARPSALTATVSPAEVSLAMNESARIVLLLHNSSAEEVTELNVQEGPVSSSLDVSDLSRPQSTALRPGATTMVSFTVRRMSDTTAPGLPVALVATYRQEAASTNPPLPPVEQVTVASMTVKPVAMAELVQVAFSGEFDPVSEDRSAEVALLVTNKRAATISLPELTVTTPRSVRVSVPAGAVANAEKVTIPGGTAMQVLDGTPLTVAPLSTRVIPLLVTGEPAVEPGLRTLLVRLVATEVGRGAGSVEAIASQNLKVEVFGESAILSALGVPLLLLLPGLIILTTLAVLLKYASPWRQILKDGSPDIATKASSGAVAGVFVSLLVVLAYPHLTRLIPGDSRNLRRSYGFDDFYYVYVWSILIAVVLWGLIAAAKPAWEWAFIVKPTDDELTVLRKLAFRRVPLDADLVKVDGADAGHDRALHAAGYGYRWYLTPPIKATVGTATTAAQTTARTELESAFAGKKLATVRSKLEKARKAGLTVGLSYEKGPFIPRPAVVDPTNAKPRIQSRRVVYL